MKEFGSFWARRREAVRAEEEAERRAAEAAEAQARAATLAEKDDAEVLSELGLPNPAAMQAGDDFAAFMTREVPEHLRRQALRTLWRSNPVLACLDGLNDYDDDYRAAALAQQPFKTAYQVGKGLTRHVEEMARKASDAERRETSEGMSEVPAAALTGPDTLYQDLPVEEVFDAKATQDEMDPSAEAPAPRRMRFRFEEAAV